jgi:micrococcal nuclease
LCLSAYAPAGATLTINPYNLRAKGGVKMIELKGTHAAVTFSRVVDGDTIRVVLPGETEDESLRILCLDTEETHAGSGKPVTPWGHKAKERAEAFFNDAAEVVIEFPGHEDLDTCIHKYRGNYGRLLVYVYRDGVDYQETMIAEGYSPYFVKYGRAEFTDHHRRYTQAEQRAQRQHIGVWNQLAVNGGEQRNYAALGIWWQLRARVIEDYRRLRALDDSLLDPRLDYDHISALARDGAEATIFTEMRTITRVGGHSGLISMGAVDRPFYLFVPDIDSAQGQEVVHLLENRYISGADDHPRRSYAYVRGVLQTYRDHPEIVVHTADQISDTVEGREETEGSGIVIAALLPDPEGADAGFERVTLRNSAAQPASLDGFQLKDQSGHRLALSGPMEAHADREIQLERGQLPLNNTGDAVYLLTPDGKVQHQAVYSASDVISGKPIWFV